MSQPSLAEDSPSAPDTTETEAEKGYQEILELGKEELQEQSIHKGEEFIETINSQEAPAQGTRLVSIKNEFPETIKIIFQAELNQNKSNQELYLNAYEDLDKLSLQTDTEYQVYVYNIHGQSIGQLRENVIDQTEIKISPFLIVKKYIFKPTQIKVIGEAELILTTEEEPAKQEELQPQTLVAQPVIKQAEAIIDTKRSIKIANISDRKVHIDIIEPGNQTIGSGWTIHNDIYEPQFLNYGSKPIKLSSSAKLILKPQNMKQSIQNAEDLLVDERGNFIWLIKDLKTGVN